MNFIKISSTSTWINLNQVCTVENQPNSYTLKLIMANGESVAVDYNKDCELIGKFLANNEYKF